MATHSSARRSVAFQKISDKISCTVTQKILGVSFTWVEGQSVQGSLGAIRGSRMATALLVTRGGLAARAARATGRGSRAAVAAAAASPDRPGTHAIDSAEEKERRSSSAFALGLPALVVGECNFAPFLPSSFLYSFLLFSLVLPFVFLPPKKIQDM